jgi:hypothetical protein
MYGEIVLKGEGMPSFFESLESRMFLSTSPAVLTLHTDEAAVKKDLAGLAKGGAAVLKTITADLKTSADKSAAKAQEKALSVALANIGAADGKAISSATTKVNADVSKLEILEAQLAKKPGSATLTMKVTAAKTALTTVAANGLAAFNAANQGNAVLVAAEAIVADGGAAGAAAANGIGAVSTDAEATGVAAGKAFSTDVSAIVGP